MANRRRRRRKKNSFLTIVVVAIAVCIAAMIGVVLFVKFSPSNERANLEAIFNLTADAESGRLAAAEDEYAISLQHSVSTDRAKIIDGTIYTSYDITHRYFDDRFYWDSNEKILIFTNAVESKVANANDTYYTVNGNKIDCGSVIARELDGNLYISLDFVTQVSPITYEIYDNPRHITVTYNEGTSDIVKARKNTQIREGRSVKNAIVKEVKEGDELNFIEEKDGWTTVMSQDGYIGYVKNSAVTDIEKKTLTSDFNEPEYVSKSLGEEVCLAWNGMGGSYESTMEGVKKVNVVSPNWFSLNSGTGGVHNAASSAYASSAHANGVQVWAMVDDFNVEGGKEFVKDTLETTTYRKNLVSNLISLAKSSGADGLNIDFEYIGKAEADDYIQFLRELSIECRNSDLFLSTDNYPPTPEKAFYNIEEQGRLVDYVFAMAYDNYVGTGNVGANSDVAYIADVINRMKEKVPAEKIVIGIPFYSREWKIIPASVAGDGHKFYENDEYGRYTLESKTYLMKTAKERMASQDAKWLDDIKMYYYEYTEGDIIYKAWIENAETVGEKLKVINEAEIGGVAFWQLGQETSDVWSTVAENIK